MNYPTLAEVEAASREQLCRWHRFLPSPPDDASVAVIYRVEARLKDAGGFTPEISRKLGWERP